MPQGSNLPALHTWNIGQNWYVDSDTGNDTTGDGSSGNPWQTLQKAADYLAATATWPTGQDVCVNCKGVFKAGGVTTGSTLATGFSTSARAPASNRFLIWRNWPGFSATIRNPDGTDQGKYAVQLGGNALNSYQIFYGLNFDGEYTRKGNSTPGSSIGLYLSGTVADSNTACELVHCRLSGFQCVAGNAQATFASFGSSHLKLAYNEVFDIGTTTGSDFQLEHGCYLQAPAISVFNCLFHNMANGHGIQFYHSGRDLTTDFDGGIISNCTVDANLRSIVLPIFASNFVVENTIVSNATNANEAAINYWGTSSTQTGSKLDHIVWWLPVGSTVLDFPVPASGWTFTNTTNVDPKFVSSSDRHLQSTSPALGYTDTTYSPADDILGNARAAGSEDAGAYEFVPAVPSGIHKFRRRRA